MPNLPHDLTFAQLLLPPGIIVAGAVVSALIEVIKRVFPNFPLNGLQQAFIYTVVIYVLTTIAVGVRGPDDLLVAFMAWLTCVGSSVLTYETAKNIDNSLESRTDRRTVLKRDEKFDDGT